MVELDKVISREHVLQALEALEKGVEEVPPGREFSRYCVVYGRKCYPVKFLVELAARFAGYTVSPGDITVDQAKRLLEDLGLIVVEIATPRGRLAAEMEEVIELRPGWITIPSPQLKAYLASNLGLLEEGLELVRTDAPVNSDRIDILARSTRDDTLVVIHVVPGIAGGEELARLLAHMAALQPSEDKVRGILVARDYERHVVEASRILENVRLVRYVPEIKMEEI